MSQATLLPLQARILEQLAVVHFATQSQLVKLCGADAPRVSRASADLFNLGLIDAELFARPKIFHIARPGCKLLGVPPPSGSRLPSWSVMAHACHRNEVAFAMAERVPGFRFIPRLALLKRGLNPGHGEHCATCSDGTNWLVLLDDYLMGSDRIGRALTRRHTPNRKYWPDHTGRAWREVVQNFLVVTTDEGQADRHRVRIARDRLPAEVMTIKPLWKT